MDTFPTIDFNFNADDYQVYNIQRFYNSNGIDLLFKKYVGGDCRGVVVTDDDLNNTILFNLYQEKDFKSILHDNIIRGELYKTNVSLYLIRNTFNCIKIYMYGTDSWCITITKDTPKQTMVSNVFDYEFYVTCFKCKKSY